jgi:DNA-binding CsgD family transcriptional regulator
MTRNTNSVACDVLNAIETNLSAQSRRIIGITKRRDSPRFIICDGSMRVLFASAGLEHLSSKEGGLQFLMPQSRESLVTKEAVFCAYDDETALRIVPLGDQLFACVAIFVDVFTRRGSVFEAAKRFGLTKRESEVLLLLISGKANSEVAERLCVAESTVGDHVKSVMRKLGASKRMELISKVFNLQHDIDAENAEHDG